MHGSAAFLENVVLLCALSISGLESEMGAGLWSSGWSLDLDTDCGIAGLPCRTAVKLKPVQEHVLFVRCVPWSCVGSETGLNATRALLFEDFHVIGNFKAWQSTSVG